jgi:hypothetical protein
MIASARAPMHAEDESCFGPACQEMRTVLQENRSADVDFLQHLPPKTPRKLSVINRLAVLHGRLVSLLWGYKPG